MLSVFLSVRWIILKNVLPPPKKISFSDPFELWNQNLYFAQLSNLLIHSIVSFSMFFSSSHYTKRTSPLVHMNAISPFGLLICVSYPCLVSLWRNQYILPYVFSMWRLLIRQFFILGLKFCMYLLYLIRLFSETSSHSVSLVSLELATQTRLALNS